MVTEERTTTYGRGAPWVEDCVDPILLLKHDDAEDVDELGLKPEVVDDHMEAERPGCPEHTARDQYGRR